MYNKLCNIYCAQVCNHTVCIQNPYSHANAKKKKQKINKIRGGVHHEKEKS